MNSSWLQFQGDPRQGLMAVLLVAIVLLLVVHGAVQLVRRRWQAAAWSFGAAAGPALAVVLVGGALAEGDIRRRRRLAALGIAAALAAGLLAMLAISAGGSAHAWWLAALTFEIIAAVGVFYVNVYAELGGGRIAVLMALRAAAVLVLMLVLFRPAVRLEAGATAPRPALPVLIDRSGSMSVADAAGVERYRSAVESLAFQRRRLEEHFEPVWHHFGPSLQTAMSLDDLAALSPEGPGTDGTDLAAAVLDAARGGDRRRLPGLLVFTDGVHNVAGDAVAAAAQAGVPLYLVGVGSDAAKQPVRPNVRLVAIEAPTEIIRENRSTFTAQVQIDGLANTTCRVRLLEEGSEQPLATAEIMAAGPSQSFRCELDYTPKSRPLAEDEPDLRRLRVVVDELAGEFSPRDNAAALHVLVTEPRVGVLYIEGTARTEFKFLRRLLDSDANLQFQALVRISGSRFLAQNAGGSQVVSLPASAEDFDQFDVIVVGDLDRTFWTNSQLELLRRWVTGGGGLLMIGGQNSLGPGGYGGTAIEDVLPVSIGGRNQPQEATPFVPQLTAEGERHPVFDGIADFFGGVGEARADDSPAQLPELLGCVTVGAAKSGAAVLAVHPTRRGPEGPLVALAVQDVGKGRAAVFTADTTHRWHMKLAGMGARSPYERFWAQLVRYLAAVEGKSRRSPPAIVLRTADPSVRAGQNVRVAARVVAPDVDPGQVRLSGQAHSADGATWPVPLAYNARAKVFEGRFEPAEAGDYRLTAVASDSRGQELARDELTFAVLAHSAEMDRLARNDALLADLAARTGGRYVDDPAKLPELLDELVARGRVIAPPAQLPEPIRLYDYTLLLVAFVALMTGEWLLRRRWQLH